MTLLKQVLNKNRVYNHVTPHETVICDSDVAVGNHISHQ
jgi:hypothetical protein